MQLSMGQQHTRRMMPLVKIEAKYAYVHMLGFRWSANCLTQPDNRLTASLLCRCITMKNRKDVTVPSHRPARSPHSATDGCRRENCSHKKAGLNIFRHITVPLNELAWLFVLPGKKMMSHNEDQLRELTFRLHFACSWTCSYVASVLLSRWRYKRMAKMLSEVKYHA